MLGLEARVWLLHVKPCMTFYYKGQSSTSSFWLQGAPPGFLIFYLSLLLFFLLLHLGSFCLANPFLVHGFLHTVGVSFSSEHCLELQLPSLSFCYSVLAWPCQGTLCRSPRSLLSSLPCLIFSLGELITNENDLTYLIKSVEAFLY